MKHRTFPLTVAAIALAVTCGVLLPSADDAAAQTPDQNITLTEFRPDFEGIWSDGTTIWVADWFDDKVYAYTLSDGRRDPSKEFDLDVGAGNGRPEDIWSDGTTIWVTDKGPAFGNGADKLFAYTLPNDTNGGTGGTRAAHKDVVLDDGNRDPTGISADDTYIWVADGTDLKLYAYTLDSGARAADRDVVLHADNNSPEAMWSDEDTIWVADDDKDKLFAYTLPDDTNGGTRDETKEFGLDPENSGPVGIWSDGATIWAMDWADHKLYAYTLDSGERELDNDSRDLTVEQGSPRGLWSDGETIWVADDGDDWLYAYTVDSRTWDPGKDFELAADNGDSWGVWSDGETIWVADKGEDKLFAYTLASGARDPGKDFELAVDNDDPRGVWSDGETIWVADWREDKLFAYTLASRTWDPGKDFELAVDNDDPRGVWSDDTYIWVADWRDDKLYAYTLASGARFAAQDLDVSGETYSPRGIWSNGTTIWVADRENQDHRTLVAFDLPEYLGAGLSGLTISSTIDSGLPSPAVLSPRFDHDHDAYTARVAYVKDSVVSVTVTPTVFDSTATVTVTVNNGADVVTGTTPDGDIYYTVSDLNAGSNVIRIEVAAGGVTWRYIVKVNRAEFGLAVNNGFDAEGIWSNDDTIWVADDVDDKLFAYTLDGERVPDDDVNLAAANGGPTGIWSNGTTIWVADWADEKLFAYTLSTGERDTGKEFDLAATDGGPTGIWSNGTTIWVADWADEKLRAYTLSTGERDTGEEFDLANRFATGIWSVDDTIWVADSYRDKLFAYTLSDGTRDDTKDVDLARDNRDPRGIWFDDTTIRVADTRNEKLFAYTLSTGERDETKEFDLAAHANNRNAKGVWSDGETIWVADVLADRVYAYTLADGGTRVPYKDVVLHDDNGDAAGIWSDGETIWVADDGDNKVFAYTLSDGTRDETKEFILESDDGANSLLVRGIWSDGTTMWVADGRYLRGSQSDWVYAYTLPDGTNPVMRDRTKEFDLDSANDGASGIWSDGATMWVADQYEPTLYAYSLVLDDEGDAGVGGRDVGRDFELVGAHENSWGAWGAWSDCDTMWVADFSDDRLFAYDLGPALEQLAIGTDALSTDFDFCTSTYTARVDNKTKTVSVRPEARESDATFTVTVDGEPALPSTNSPSAKSSHGNGSNEYELDLEVGVNIVNVEVTVPHRRSRSYTVNVIRPKSSDATLSDLAVSLSDNSSVDLSFNSDTVAYTVGVGNSVDEVMVTPTAADEEATVTVDGMKVDSGNPETVALDVGVNVIRVVVEAQDGTTRGYTVTVTREASGVATLSGLVISDGVLDPAFDPGAFGYVVDVGNLVDEVTVTSTVAHDDATVTVNETPVTSGGGHTVSLDVGVNVIRVVVEAQDGTTTEEYTVTVDRAQSSDATLSGLVISEGVLSPRFASGTVAYTAGVVNLVDSVTVTSTVSEGKATVTVAVDTGATVNRSGSDYTFDLGVGSNLVTIEVTAQDGTTQTYTVTVTRAESEDATLSGLVISPGVLSPSFDPVDLAYTAGVVNVVTSVRVTPTANHGDATVTVTVDTGATVNRSGSDYTFDLDVGSNVITIVVRAQDGTTRRYRVTVDRAESSDAALSGLDISGGSLSPGFGSGTRDYTASVLNSVKSVTVTPEARENSATVTVNGSTVTSGSDRSVSLVVGSNVITIEVTAQDGTTIRIYRVTVTRAADSNAGLSGLTISSGVSSPVVLSPGFGPGEFAYTAMVVNSVESVMVTPTVANSATVTVDGTDVESGNPETVALDVGVNVIRVVVEAQDGTTRGYTVTVTREASGVATLSGLVISDGVLDPAFDPGAFRYTAMVGNSVDEVTATSTVADADATVTVTVDTGAIVNRSGSDYTFDLDVGFNVVTIEVTAQDGTTQTYTVTVTRAESSDATLSGLVISPGVLSPSFDPVDLAYTAGVDNVVTSVRVTPTANHGDATVTVTVDTGATVNRSGSDYTVRDLDVGSNVITIVVRAQDGTTRRYRVTVDRAESSDAALSGLDISEGVLSPRFGSGTRDYTASVLNSVDSVTVTPTANHGGATVTVTVDTGATVNRSGSDYTFDLDVGSNVITIVVRAQDGTTRGYTVTVDRAESSDAALSGLDISGGSLSPGFASGTRDYTASVLNSVDSVTVTPTVSEDNATVTVTVDGASVPPSGSDHVVSLDVGSNVITIEVTAQDGTTRRYRVTVTRAADSNAGLSGLTISSGVSSPVVLSPGFASGKFAYTAMVVNSVDEVTATSTVADADATVTVTVDTGATVNRSDSDYTFDLDVGSNLVTIEVTAQDGLATQTYTVRVTRAGSSDATLSDLHISEGVLSTVFDPVDLAYTAMVVNSVESVMVTPTANHGGATITVNGSTVASGSAQGVSLAVGDNVITIVVKAQDGAIRRYTVTVDRAVSSDATLSGLTISGSSLSPGFASSTVDYTARVVNSATSVTVTPTVSEGEATVTVTVDTGATVNRSGSDYTVRDLDVGSNVITIVVRAQDGTTRRYRVTVDRAESSDAALSDLDISGGSLSPGFGSGTRDYTASVLNSVDSVTVTPTVNHGGATVTVTVDTGATVNRSGSDYTFDLDVGSNVITIVVRAQDGTTRGYTVTVDRAVSSDATLSGLDISGGSLSPGFGSGTRDYTASVLNSVDSVTVTPEARENNATVTVNGDAWTSGSDYTVRDLDVGSNVITIVVTAQDGTTIRIYRVTVTRAADSNAGLSGLTISSGVSSPVVLSPGFASGKFAYTAMVDNEVTAVMVTPTVANSATVTVNGGAATSGGRSVSLVVGSNVITIVVTAQDGLATRTYTVRVTRAGFSDATLSGLDISPGRLSPSFASGTGSYTLMVGNLVDSVTVTPTANHGGATVTVTVVTGATVNRSGSDYTFDLDVGSNVIIIEVTAEDGAIRGYTVTVDRAVSSDAALSGLTISGSSLSPRFASSTVDYTARVVNSATSVTVTPTVSEGEATVTVTVDTGATVNRSGSDYTFDLDVGSNLITIEVTAEDFTTQTYTVTVTRTGSEDATLSGLTISEGLLSPTFDVGRDTYTARVGNLVDSVTVTPTVSEDNATVTVTVDGASVPPSGSDHVVSLDVGSNVIRVVVTAQDGTTTRTYTVTVTRAESSDATLNGLAISPGPLSPTFASGTDAYTVSVVCVDTSVMVTPTANHEEAMITVDGTLVTSGVGHLVSVPHLGSNVITIVVTARDGTTTETYTVTVTRAGETTGLKELAISPGGLSPVFNPGTCAYTVSVPNSVDSVTVTTVSDVTLTVTVTTVNDAMVAVTVTVPVDNPALVAARDSSHYTVRDLDVGFNTIDIAVGGIRAYTITIDRAGTTGTGTGTGTGGGSNGGGSGSSGGGSSGGGGGGLDVGVATFVVANGWSAADVGVASVLSARVDGAVVVYTAGDVLSAATAELLREALPAEIVIVGGTAAVSFDVRAQMRAASPESGISRVTGEDRVATAAGAARRILGDPAQAGRVTLVVANGWSPPDVGAAAALAARSGRSAVVYTRHDRLPEASAALLGDYDVARVILVGGTAAISAGVHDAIVAGTGASVSRLTGADRVDTAAQAARRVLGSPAGAPEGVTLVIANGWSPPDVGVAAALAAATENSAVAYTSQAALPAATAALIRDYRPAQIIIVGGTAAVANDVRQAITDTASADASVRRITGSTRTDTAARAARRILADS